MVENSKSHGALSQILLDPTPYSPIRVLHREYYKCGLWTLALESLRVTPSDSPEVNVLKTLNLVGCHFPTSHELYFHPQFQYLQSQTDNTQPYQDFYRDCHKELILLGLAR